MPWNRLEPPSTAQLQAAAARASPVITAASRSTGNLNEANHRVVIDFRSECSDHYGYKNLGNNEFRRRKPQRILCAALRRWRSYGRGWLACMVRTHHEVEEGQAEAVSEEEGMSENISARACREGG